jgi:hypothetical protein
MKYSVINIILWICQVTLASTLLWAAGMKLLNPVSKLKKTWPWVAETPGSLVKFTGATDMAGAVGLVCPMLFNIYPVLTPIAALCVTLLMVIAGLFHILRGEGSQITINIVFALLAVFIAWGRFAYIY